MKKQFKKSRPHQSEVKPPEPKDIGPIKLSLSSADPNAFHSFKERMYSLANTLFPRMGVLFIEHKLPTIPVADEKLYNLRKEADQVRFRDAIKREGDARAALELASSKLFTALLDELSEESLQAVKQALIIHEQQELEKAA